MSKQVTFLQYVACFMVVCVGISDEVSEPESVSRRLIGQNTFVPVPRPGPSLDRELDIVLRRTGVLPAESSEISDADKAFSGSKSKASKNVSKGKRKTSGNDQCLKDGMDFLQEQVRLLFVLFVLCA